MADVTDKDRETLDLFDCISERVTRKSALQAIAQARAEERAESGVGAEWLRAANFLGLASALIRARGEKGKD